MKRRKQSTPLLSALTISMLCSSLAAMAGAHSFYQKYNTTGWSQPAIAVLMQGLASQGYPWAPSGSSAGSGNAAVPSVSQPNTDGLPVTFIDPSETAGAGKEGDAAGQANAAAPNDSPDTQAGLKTSSNASDGQPDNATPGSALNGQTESMAPDNASSGQTEPTAPDGQPEPMDPDGASGGQTEPTAPDNVPDGQTKPAAPDGTSNGQTEPAVPNGQPEAAKNDDAPQPEAKKYEFTTVTQEYFDDALLIGDSRAEGVALYSGWDNLTYYAEGGMTVYNMFQSKAAEEDGQKLTIEEALQKRTFGKIYLEIGINEMGTGTVDSFMEAYEAAVTRLRELQPDAILYLCGIMYVKQSKSESDPIFNNPNIQARNDRIAGLADGENIFYLDINELVTDETGNLNPDYTWDEVHLLGKYDSLWLDYFCSHGIVKENT